MRVEIETELEWPAERVWAELLTPRLLAHVAAPWLRFEPIDPPTLPEVWSPGRYRVAMRVFGWIPIGKQWVGIELPDGAEPTGWPRRVRDDGSGDWVRRWDHWIEIEPLTEDATRYRDRVDVEAGALTPLVWLFAQGFYRHRQRRWRELARRGAY